MFPAVIPDMVKYDGWQYYSVTMPDKSLMNTMTLLLYPRVMDMKLVAVRANSNNQVYQCCDALNENVYGFYIVDGWNNKDKILTDFFVGVKAECFDKAGELLTKKTRQKVSIYTISEKNSVFVFVEQLDLIVFHAIQSLFHRYYKIFEENPITEDEQGMLQSFTKTWSDKYFETTRRLRNNKSFAMYRIANKINQIGTSIYCARIRSVEDQLKQIKAEMDNLMAKYSKACKQYSDNMIVLSGLQNKTEDMDSKQEVAEYLADNKHVDVVSIDNGRMDILVKTEFMPYLASDYDAISKARDYFNNFGRTISVNKNDVKLICDALFSTKRCMKLKVCANFSLDLTGSDVCSIKRYDFGGFNEEYNDYIPNPHLNLYDCMLQNRQDILNQLLDGDIIGAIECCIACAQRVNIHETRTFTRLVDDVMTNKGRCLIYEGQEITVKQALDYLKEKENAA